VSASQELLDRWNDGEDIDIAELLATIDLFRNRHRKLLAIVIDQECECDLDEPCVRCTILNQYYPGAASMRLKVDV
jgi:hypothetical protein